jgi:hypothetical protein
MRYLNGYCIWLLFAGFEQTVAGPVASSACVIPAQAFEAILPSPTANCQDAAAITAIKEAVLSYILSLPNVLDNSVVVSVTCRDGATSGAGRRLRQQSGVAFVVTASFSVDTVGAPAAETAVQEIKEDTCEALSSLCGAESPVEIDTANVDTNTYNPQAPEASLLVAVTPSNPAVTTPITITATYARPGIADISGVQIALNPGSADVACTTASPQPTNVFGQAVFVCSTAAVGEVSFTVTTANPLGGDYLSATATTTAYAYPTLSLAASTSEPSVGTAFTLTATYARPGDSAAAKEVTLAADPAGNVNCDAVTAVTDESGAATFTCTATTVSLSGTLGTALVLVFMDLAGVCILCCPATVRGGWGWRGGR